MKKRLVIWSFIVFVSMYTFFNYVLDLYTVSVIRARTSLSVRKHVGKLRENYNNENSAFVHIDTTLYVYSAYFDEISERLPVIRIIAIDDPRQDWEHKLDCVFYNSEKIQFTQNVQARKVNSTSSYNTEAKFGLVFILCDLSLYTEGIPPSFVRLISKQTNKSVQDSSLLTIQYSSFSNYDHTVAACVQPIHSGFEEPVRLLEWIEYNRLLNVTHFTFYNNSIGPRTAKLLENYNPKLVSILNWTLPQEAENELWVFGQLVAATDCAFRYRGVAKYVLAFDTDEFLIPPEGYTSLSFFLDHIWNQLEFVREISYVRFRSKVSFLNWGRDDTTTLNHNLSDCKICDFLVSEMMIPSRSKFLPAKQTKFVMRPERIIEYGVHWPEQDVRGTTHAVLELNDGLGYYFHFRECSPYFQEPNQVLENDATCLEKFGIQKDDIVQKKWSYELVSRVEKVIDLR